MDRNGLFNQIADMVRNEFRSDDASGAMTAARFGQLLRRSFPNALEELGLPKLKDLLNAFEARGLIKTGIGSKSALVVWLPQSEQLRAWPSRHQGPHRSLRPEIWRAFVATNPTGKRYLDRGSGRVLLGQLDVPEIPGDWIEIPKVSESDEKAAAADFLKEHEVPTSPQVKASLDSPRWFFEFPQLLGPSLGPAWKRRRTGYVVEKAESWRNEHRIPDELVYQDGPQPNRAELSAGVEHGAEVRDAVLKALAKMSTDELLRLPVPVRYVLEIVRPDIFRR